MEPERTHRKLVRMRRSFLHVFTYSKSSEKKTFHEREINDKNPYQNVAVLSESVYKKPFEM